MHAQRKVQKNLDKDIPMRFLPLEQMIELLRNFPTKVAIGLML